MRAWCLIVLALLFPIVGGGFEAHAQDEIAGTLGDWVLEGELVDDEEVVRSFLRPVIQEHQNWSPDSQQAIRDFLLQMGYHTRITSVALEGEKIRATIAVTPVTQVRYIQVEIKAGNYERFKQPIFANEIQRRMTLRPGGILPLDEDERRELLLREARRVQKYLREDGFYEARVEISESAVEKYQSRLWVNVIPGPPYFVGEVEVVGNSALSADKIAGMFHHDRICIVADLCYGKKRFSISQFRKDIQSVKEAHQKLGFPSVDVQDTFDERQSFRRYDKRVNFRVTIIERRQIDVIFQGNRSVNVEALHKQLTFNEVESYDDVEVEASAEAIREYYQSEGFFEARVEWSRELFTDLNSEHIIFDISEGPRMPVRRITFSGNTAIRTGRLTGIIATKVYAAIILGDPGGYATATQLAQDKKKILALYQEQGYLEAKVALEVSRFSEGNTGPVHAALLVSQKKTNGLYLHFDIEEGEQTLISESEIALADGEKVPKKLLSRLRSKPGTPFSEDKLGNDEDTIRNFYFERGYPRTEVFSEYKRTESGFVIDTKVDKHSVARIGKIAIRGNFKTSDWVILSELKLREGSLLTRSTAARAQSNLRKTGLFSTVQINFVGQENLRQEVVNVLVKVEERHDHRLAYNVGGGYATDTQAFGEAGATIGNLGGIGMNLDLRVLWGQQQRQAEAKLRLPRWILNRYVGTELNLDTTLSYVEDETERFGLLTTQGFSVQLSKQWQRQSLQGWFLSLRYDYRSRNRDVDLIRPAGNSDDISLAPITTVTSAIGPRLIIDRRRDREGNQNPLTPGKGYRLDLGVQFAEDFVVTSANRFLKFGFAGQYYASPLRGFTLSTGLRYDHGVPLGGEALLPEVERFFAGGDTSVRGYEEDRLAVEYIDNPLSPSGDFERFRIVPAAGNIRLIHNLDLQVDVWSLAGYPVATALFLDSGMITNSLLDVQRSKLRHGFGMALFRWVLPVGSASIEYAVPLTPKLGDDPRGRFHLNLGVNFN